MTYRWHLIGGIVAYMLGMLFLPSTFLNLSFQLIPLLAICLFGALLPDIDTTSKIRKLVYTKWLVLIFAILLLFNTNSFFLIVLFGFALLPFFVRHRGLFHNLFFLALITIMISTPLCCYFPTQRLFIFLAGYFFFIGTISHVILDKL